MRRYESYLRDRNIELSELQINQFQKYYEMLVEKNKVMNLTAITEYDEVVEKHFIDSISIAEFIDIKGKMIDVGTGAGFPGIPLKIVFPDLEVVLLDSLNKRVKFLNEVIEELNLKKIKAIHGRAEEVAKNKEYREAFDYSVSRAVANLSTLTEYCLPFVKIGGSFISYKSGNIDKELKNSETAIKKLGGNIQKVDKFELSNKVGMRSFVIINKISKTDKKYPRKAGTPAKEPLS